MHPSLEHNHEHDSCLSKLVIYSILHHQQWSVKSKSNYLTAQYQEIAGSPSAICAESFLELTPYQAQESITPRAIIINSSHLHCSKLKRLAKSHTSCIVTTLQLYHHQC